MGSGWKWILICGASFPIRNTTFNDIFSIIDRTDCSFWKFVRDFTMKCTIITSQIAPFAIVILDKWCAHIWHSTQQIFNGYLHDSFYINSWFATSYQLPNYFQKYWATTKVNISRNEKSIYPFHHEQWCMHFLRTKKHSTMGSCIRIWSYQHHWIHYWSNILSHHHFEFEVWQCYGRFQHLNPLFVQLSRDSS